MRAYSICCRAQKWNKSNVRMIITIKRGKAQRDGRSPLFYRRRTFVVTCKNLDTIATGIGYRVVLPLHCPSPKIPSFEQDSGTYLLYKPSCSQFYVQIANFSLPWQQRSVQKPPVYGTKIWDISPIQADL